jgi:hypothetical protein
MADAITKLEADHDRIEALFERLKHADEAETRRLGTEVCHLVRIHMALEEEQLYPALRGREHADEDKLDEGLVEHDTGKLLINDVLADPGQDKLAPKLQVLGEQMEHHHKEEEQPEKGVFAMARKAGLDLSAMLGTMETREAELRAETANSAQPPADMNFVDIEASEG